MARLLRLFVASSLVLLAGCQASPSSPSGGASTPSAVATSSGAVPGSTTHEITVGGTQRSFRLHIPAGLTGASALVVMMHGGGGNSTQAEQGFGWDVFADREHFVAAFPDGLTGHWSVGGGCCDEPGKAGVDDVAFIEALVSTVKSLVDIDPSRIYATGFSNGGMMTYRLACDSTLFAAVAPVSGTLLGDCSHPKPVSVLHIHGLADKTVPFDGSPGQAGNGQLDGPPIPAVIASWRRIDNCQTPAKSTAGGVTTSRSTCAQGRAVDVITIATGGHQWPNPKSSPVNATEVIWQFFVAHPLPS